MRSSLLSIGAVLATAAVLRYWNITRGAAGPAESRIIEPVLQLLQTGSYHPRLLDQPTLPIYLQTAVAVVHFLWGALRGAWQTTGAFGAGQVIPWGRCFSALLGTAVVFVVFQIGTRWGARHALLAAGLMAVTPMHVAASRKSAPGAADAAHGADAAAVARGDGRGLRRTRLAAAAAAGLAAATHYAGATAIVMPLVAVWMTSSNEGSRVSRAAEVVVAAVVAFVVATPLSVRDLPAFLDGFAAAASPARAAVEGAERADLLQQLLWALQWPGLILAFAGVSLAVVRTVTGPGHTRWTLLASFPLVYFAAVAWHGATAADIVLPMLPASTVLAAIAVVSGGQLRRFEIPRAARTALIAGLTVAVLLPPLVLAIDLVRQAEANARRGRRRGSIDRRVPEDRAR